MHQKFGGIPLYRLRLALWRQVLLCLSLFFASLSQASVPAAHKDAPHLRVSLLSESPYLIPGASQSFALQLAPEAGWHTYWANPGASGKPTQWSWSLPDGFRSSDIRWPTPERIAFGGSTVFGYAGEVTLLSDLVVPPRDVLQPIANSSDGLVALVAKVSWLVCKEVCVQGDAELRLSLPLATEGREASTGLSPAVTQQFANARVALPKQLAGAPAVYRLSPRALVVDIAADALPVFERKPDVFIQSVGLVDAAQLPAIHFTDDGLRVTVPRAQSASGNPLPTPAPAFLPLVLRLDERNADVRSFSVLARLEAGEVIAEESQLSGVKSIATSTSTSSTTEAGVARSLPIILLFALLGGLVLNAMPCVFPVLSLKVISLVEHSGHDAQQRRQHGLAYTAGVVGSFLLVAAVLIALRAAGEQVGWGFQLQAPGFVALLIYVLFLLGLSLSGVLEFGTALQNIGHGSVMQSSPLRASFLTGVLAAVVATPCTAPFMGTAMGFALTQPLGIALLTFAVLGLGLALPFLAIAFVPALASWLPAPGNWMVRLKEALAFPIYLTVVWLLWVFARQTGVNAMAALLVGLVLLALAMWLRRASMFGPRARVGLMASLLCVALAISALFWALQLRSISQPGDTGLPTQSAVEHEGSSEAWSQAKLDAALRDGKTVFVNMTADWCITCKVNERVALKNAQVKRALARPGNVYLVGDWTNSDPAISVYLETFERNGVPLYVVYKPGQPAQLLPQVLTPGMVLSALE